MIFSCNNNTKHSTPKGGKGFHFRKNVAPLYQSTQRTYRIYLDVNLALDLTLQRFSHGLKT
jgi:hypothetical protein